MWKNHNIKCYICGKVCDDPEHLDEHLIAIHWDVSGHDAYLTREDIVLMMRKKNALFKDKVVAS